MFNGRNFLLAEILFYVLLIFGSNRAHAQSYTASATDTLTKHSSEQRTELKPASHLNLNDAVLLQEIQTKLSDAAGRQKLMLYIKQPGINAIDNKKLYYNLAYAFVRLKLYPLAMKSFLKSQFTDNLNGNVYSAYPGLLNFAAKDDSILQKQNEVLLLKRPRSKQITYQHIVNTFNDGKPAAAYGLLIHIKQPVPGKPKVHRLADSGHSFITLIKYNTDTSYVSLSFSFYPWHQHPFAGTPLFPYSHSAFKDDHNYNYDEVAGKFIDEKTFDTILSVVKQYNGIGYHLSRKNCTDFVLDAAAAAGILISETSGGWPLGRGNNPGITGQSILKGKIRDINSDNPTNLFIDCNINMPLK